MKLNGFVLAFGLSLGVLGAAQPPDDRTGTANDVHLQQTTTPGAPGLDNNLSLLANNEGNAPTAPDSSISGEVNTPDSPRASGSPQIARPARNDQWSVSVTPYLWFPGVHGTIGALDRDVNFRASAIDLLSHFRFGLMAAAEARRNRIVLPLDVFWVRLADSKALPFPNLGAATADVKLNVFVLTPKVGYRFVDEEKIKLDVLSGFRYWHLGENLKFSPSNLNLNVSPSQNWADPLVGVRIEVPLSGKLAVDLTSDVGGWGVGSQLDYQAAGLLGYKIKENVTLNAGYRYLFVDYSAGGGRAVLDAALSGVAFGVTINLK